MANIPIPENDDSLELNVRYQPDMVLEGMLDATVPEFKKLTLTMGGEVYDLAGGGSDLPEYTDSDVGKVLTVAEGADTQNLPLFPEQTAEAGDPYEVQNASNLDKFVVGAVVTFTIDDEPYERTVSINELSQLPSVTVVDELSENTYMLVLAGGKLYLDISAPVGTTAEVSATVEAPIVELAWEEPSGLPEITNSDEGKVLTVTDTYELTTVLPEQSVTFVDHVAVLSNCDLSGVQSGEATITVNDTTETGFGSALGIYTLSFNLERDNGDWILFDGTYSLATATVSAQALKGTGDLHAVWEGGTVPDLTLIEDEINTAVQTAITNAETSGYTGVSISMSGSTTTAEKAELVARAAKKREVIAFGVHYTACSTLYEPEPSGSVVSATGTISFIIPVRAVGFTPYSLMIYISTSLQGSTPKMGISAQATKLINYPSNG